MSEIEKLYENAGMEKIELDYPDNYEPFYPEFTAEKQLALIKWLMRLCKNGENIKDSFILIETLDNNYRFYLVNPNWVNSYHRVTSLKENFEEMLAGFINNLWQDLTETEKVEIKEILE